MPRALIEPLFDGVFRVTVDDGRQFDATQAEVNEFRRRERPEPWTERRNPRRAPDPGDADADYGE